MLGIGKRADRNAKRALRKAKAAERTALRALRRPPVEGPKGAPGLPGERGSDGADGSNGADGIDGSPDTSAQVLAKLLTVDGPGSGVDADLLDGMGSADFLAAGATAVNADAVDGRSAGCAAATTEWAGECWENDARTAIFIWNASQNCAAAGGRLPHALELRAYALRPEFTVDAGNEWSQSVYNNGSTTIYVIAEDGSLNSATTGTTKKYRCVFPLIR